MTTQTHNYLGYFLVALIFFILAALYPVFFYNAGEKFFWYDMILHFLGGAWIAGMVVWYFLKKNNLEIRSLSRWTVFGWTLLIGIGWEIFEIFVSIATQTDWYSYIDGASDLFLDLLGAYVALVVFAHVLKDKYRV